MPNPSELARIEEENEIEEETLKDIEYEKKLRAEYPWLPELSIRHLVGGRKYSIAGGKTVGQRWDK